jgi:hypothetical protein
MRLFAVFIIFAPLTTFIGAVNKEKDFLAQQRKSLFKLAWGSLHFRIFVGSKNQTPNF